METLKSTELSIITQFYHNEKNFSINIIYLHLGKKQLDQSILGDEDWRVLTHGTTDVVILAQAQESI